MKKKHTIDLEKTFAKGRSIREQYTEQVLSICESESDHDTIISLRTLKSQAKASLIQGSINMSFNAMVISFFAFALTFINNLLNAGYVTDRSRAFAIFIGLGFVVAIMIGPVSEYKTIRNRASAYKHIVDICDIEIEKLKNK